MWESLDAEKRRRSRRKIDRYNPDTGPLRRELYHKHLEFFRKGSYANERLLMAGNRCGKTTAGAYELTLHLTGEYPHWWEGRRFDTPIDAWAAGDTAKTVRDILQLELLGPQHARGTGMIPGDAIIRMTTAHGVADAVDTVYVRHVTGGVSSLGFKSYSEGRECFQGTSRHVIWIDEEAPMPVYVEALMRTMTVNGIVMVTFTPLNGHTELVQSFLDACT
jgi:phage terminase large subunit-like protein